MRRYAIYDSKDININAVALEIVFCTPLYFPLSEFVNTDGTCASANHLINEDMLKQCHKELDRNKAVGIDKVTQDLCNVSIKKENIYET